jgi:hypothetical protein
LRSIKTEGAGAFDQPALCAVVFPKREDVAYNGKRSGRPSPSSVEGIMAKANIVPVISRRKLLATAAAASAAGIAPRLPDVHAAVLPGAAQTVSGTPNLPALNVSAGMARRILEIEARNAIRREAGLPLLSHVRELRAMKKVEREQQFERFYAIHGPAVLDEILHRRAEALAIGNRVRATLLEEFRPARRPFKDGIISSDSKSDAFLENVG